MKHIEIPAKNYSQSHAETIQNMRTQVAELSKTGKKIKDHADTIQGETPIEIHGRADFILALRDRQASMADTEASILEQIAVLERTPPAVVKRHENIVLQHESRRDFGAVHEFTASFDEVQQVIPCPECGAEVFIPSRYRGMP
jgi:hypothetical protein